MLAAMRDGDVAEAVVMLKSIPGFERYRTFASQNSPLNFVATKVHAKVFVDKANFVDSNVLCSFYFLELEGDYIAYFYGHSLFDVKIAAAVSEETNLPFITAENKFEALVPEGLSRHVISSKKAQANWYTKLLEEWK